MAETIQLYEIVHTSPEYKTIGDFTNSFGSPISGYYQKEEDFINIKDENGVTNKERIFKTYNDFEKSKYENEPAKNLLLKIGTKLVIPAEKVERNTLLTQGIEVVENNIVAFKAKALTDLEKDTGYVQITKPISGKISSGTLKEIYPDMTVWIWCRKLSSRQDVTSSKAYQAEGEIFDLTPFISKVSTNMTKNGGNWQITLPPLICSLNEEGKWTIKKASLQFYSNPKNLSLSDQGYIAEASIFDLNMNRNQFLFHNIIGTNDLIFIRFETLKMEEEKRFSDKNNLAINKKNLPGNIYDMIGLTDTNNISVIPTNNDVTVNISGRDLSKLFIEDGTYFFPTEISEGKLNFAGGSTAKNSLMQRVFSDNALMYFTLWYNNSIERVFEFVIQQLSTIKVVPDSLFSDYGERRNTRFDTADAFKAKPLNQQLEGYKKKAIQYITQLRKENKISYLQQLEAERVDNDIFFNLLKFLQDIRTEKVRITSGNSTEGWKAFKWNGENISDNGVPSYFFNKLFKPENYGNSSIYDTVFKKIVENIDYYIDIQNSTGNYQKEFERKINTGIWQIIKLVIDKAISERRIVDSSASSANGSLMNFFRKVCQEPFVEYYMDTYGDTYNIIARKPPTDQVGLISLLQGKVNNENGRIIDGVPAVIDVFAEDVLRESLSFDDRDVYSWYHLTPRYNYLGDDSTLPYLYLPALFFEEYADIWGSRPMDICHNYMPFIPLDAANDKVLDISEKQAVFDLKYMVESNQYNPFVRKGMLVLNGDRRLKIGNIIRYKPTGEIFFIDAVQQNYVIGENTIDRTTTIYVSRGMVEQLIYGIPVTGNNVDQTRDHISYFNIINTDLNLKYVDSETTEKENVQIGTRTIQPNNTPLNVNYPSNNIVQNINIGTSKLDNYQPDQKAKFIQLINGINSLGYSVHVTDTTRTFAQQKIFFDRNKKSGEKNAPPGKSKHEIGDAMDLNIKSIKTGKQYFKKDSKAEWESTGVPALAKSLGFKWGGDFGSYHDPVHFQIQRNQSNTTTEPIYKTVDKVVKSKFLDKANVFSNFKVNPHVFNFFLRNEQFSNNFNTGSVVRQIYKPDVERQLGQEVEVTAKRKK